MGSFGSVEPSRSTFCHRARQLNDRPERKRLRVSRTPTGEIATVKGSPSISISRRISLLSFVAIPCLPLSWMDVQARNAPRSLRSGGQDVLRVPLTPVLHEPRVPDETGFHEHDVGWLKHALEVRRVFLHQREHLAQPIQ